MAAITAAVVAAGAGIASGVMSAEAARKQGNKNRDAQERANLLNYALFVQSRGGDASKIFEAIRYPGLAVDTGVLLPGYQEPGTEKALLARALAASKAIGSVPPETSLAEYEAIIQGQMPAIAQGDQFIRDIYSGGLEAERMAALEPVIAARERGVQAEQGAIDLALQEAINQMAADEARKGYVGTGTLAQNRMLAATLNARQAAARAKAAADVQAEMDRRAVKEGGVDLRFKSLNLPVQRAGQLIDLAQAPETALAQRSNLEMQPLAPFRMTPAAPPQQAPLIRDVVPSAGAVALSGVAQGLGGVAGAIGANQTARGYETYNRMAASGQVPQNFGTLTPAEQNDYLRAWNAAQQQPAFSGG